MCTTKSVISWSSKQNQGSTYFRAKADWTSYIRFLLFYIACVLVAPSKLHRLLAILLQNLTVAAWAKSLPLALGSAIAPPVQLQWHRLLAIVFSLPHQMFLLQLEPLETLCRCALHGEWQHWQIHWQIHRFLIAELAELGIQLRLRLPKDGHCGRGHHRSHWVRPGVRHPMVARAGERAVVWLRPQPSSKMSANFCVKQSSFVRFLKVTIGILYRVSRTNKHTSKHLLRGCLMLSLWGSNETQNRSLADSMCVLDFFLGLLHFRLKISEAVNKLNSEGKC